MKAWQLAIIAVIAAGIGAYMFFQGQFKAIIAKFEGLSLTPYKDAAGIWTIGYGHKIVAGDPYYPVGSVQQITQDEADALLADDTSSAKTAVERLVLYSLSTPQLQALTSFVYNVGQGAFAGSTMLQKLNRGDFTGAADEFDKWTHAGGIQLAGLIQRRAAEKQLFLS